MDPNNNINQHRQLPPSHSQQYQQNQQFLEVRPLRNSSNSVSPNLHSNNMDHNMASVVTLPSLPTHTTPSSSRENAVPVPNLPKSQTKSFSPHQPLMQMPIPQGSQMNIPKHSHTHHLGSMTNILNNSTSENTSNDSKYKKSGGLRLRVKKACDRCKRQKIKCDGEAPCRVCSKNDHSCTYSHASGSPSSSSNAPFTANVGNVHPVGSESGQSKERPVLEEGFDSTAMAATVPDPDHVPVLVPATKTATATSSTIAAPNSVSEGYTAYLENKVLELERKVAKLSPSSAELLTASYQEKIFHENSYTVSKDKYRVMRRYQNILPRNFATEISQTILDLSLINQNKPDDEQIVIPRIQYYGWNLSGGHYLKQRKLPEFERLFNLQDKADLNCVNWLLNYFFLKINPLYCIIHKRVFNDQYDSYLNNLSKKDESTRLFSAMLYLILALTVRFADSVMPFEIKARIIGGLEEKLFDSGYEVISKLSFEWQSYELIQCWILITFYLRVTHRQNSSFMSLGSAIRMMKGMSLNLNLVPESLQKYAYEEIKMRRIFWIVYTWDKIYSFQSGKDSEIADDQIFVPLPPLDQVEQLTDDWLNPVALSMIHLSIIASEVLKYNQTHSEYDCGSLKTITDKLYQWKSQTEKVLAQAERFKTQLDQELISQLYLTYHDILLNIHNKILVSSNQLQHSPTSNSALIEHSQEALNIIQSLSNTNELIKPWWLTLTILFNISLTTLMLISYSPQHSLVPTLHTSLSFLRQLENQGQFGMVKECIWCLNTLNYLSMLKFENGAKLFKTEMEHELRSGGGGLRNDLNKIKFYQFGKVKEQKKQKETSNSDGKTNGRTNLDTLQYNPATSNSDLRAGTSDNIVDTGMGIQDLSPSSMLEDPVDLMGNLKWFDQWLNDFK